LIPPFCNNIGQQRTLSLQKRSEASAITRTDSPLFDSDPESRQLDPKHRAMIDAG
jgi:hypothetical protein